MSGTEGNLAAGIESWSRGGIRPVKIISASGIAKQNFGPYFDVGRSYSVRLQAVIENPNRFPVSYLPHIEAILDIDVESNTAPFKVSMP